MGPRFVPERFQQNEALTFAGEQIVRAEVYFGWDLDWGGKPGANLALCGLEMSDLSEHARLVLDSLETKPALNTPALIAQNEGIEREDAEAGLAELAEAGIARQSVMGWKLRS